MSSAAKESTEKEVLEVPEMATAVQVWPAPVTKGYLPEQKLGEWKATGEHRIPNLEPGEIVLFVPFIEHGLGLPTSPFFHGLLHYYRITLNHLNPNSFLHLSIFVHLCEAFLGIPPSLSLFRYFFHLKPQPRHEETNVLGGYGIQFRQGLKSKFFDYDLVDSVRDWHVDWFYAANLIPSLSIHSGSGPSVNDRWDKNPVSPAEVQAIQPLLNRISMLK